VKTVRVLPDVTGLDRQFDYLIPTELSARVDVGTIVRCVLHGRRITAWVTAIDPPDGFSAKEHNLTVELKPIIEVVSRGPAPEVVALALWAAQRWVGRPRPLLVSASPKRVTKELPRSQRTGRSYEPRSPATTALLAAWDQSRTQSSTPAGAARGVGLMRLAPAEDLLAVFASAIAHGPTLIVMPSVEAAQLTAARLRRSGVAVAVMPEDWSLAASGVDVVIGARATAFAPCPGLSVAILVDEHDEAHQSESTPTWHAREVLAERCRAADAFLLMLSPIPSLEALLLVPPVHPSAQREREGWPTVEVVDRTDEVPWKKSLLSSQLIEHLRVPGRRVVCVSNTTGRAKLLACRTCRELLCCEGCEAAVSLTDSGVLECGRCALSRPPVCARCGGTALANLRPGVTRLREELEAAAGRPVFQVGGRSEATDRRGDRPDGMAEIHVGTEAVLHRVTSADVVAFLDLDRELLAPRYRATEQVMALMVRAARLLGPRRRNGVLLLQTFIPDHEVISALVAGAPAMLVPGEQERRIALGLPPYGALAQISGKGSVEFAQSLPQMAGVQIGQNSDGFLVRASDIEQLQAALMAGERTSSSRLRITIDPPRI
jgi:primosomal protein N' (replication factor Y) (superfamily II helicase)